MPNPLFSMRYRLRESKSLREKYGPVLDDGWVCEGPVATVLGADIYTAANNGNVAALMFCHRCLKDDIFPARPYYGKIGYLGEIVSIDEIILDGGEFDKQYRAGKTGVAGEIVST